MRGLVMVLMVTDRASMAFDGHHLDHRLRWVFGCRHNSLAGGRIFPALARSPLYGLGRVPHGYFPGLERRTAVMLVLLYPACRWYRTVKAEHPRSFLKYL
jgi:hypothetical protein